VDLGNLRASKYIVTATGKNKSSSPSFKGDKAGEMGGDHSSVVSKQKGKAVGKPIVIFGFSANYAAAVEENNDPKEWKRLGSGPHFLRDSIKRNSVKAAAIISKRAKIK
jgi:hypothetical protein